MARVALIIPPSTPVRARFLTYQAPINMASLAAYIMREGHEAEIWDLGLEPLNLKTFHERLERFKPEIAGFHCKTFNASQGARLAELCKEKDSSVKTLVGGPHISAVPRITLRAYPAFDGGVVGEGEATLLDICNAVDRGEKIAGTPGVVALSGDPAPKRPLIQNLDSLPLPARRLLDRDLYRRVHATRGIDPRWYQATEIYTARGCPGRCIFCASCAVFGRSIRFRSADHVMEEVEECLKMGYNHIIFQDDTFTLQNDRLSRLLQGFRKRGSFSWSCDSRVDTVDLELLREMKASGCRKISFGVESGSPRILELIDKGITVEEAIGAFRDARRAGIEILEATFMIGSHPDETPKDVEMTRKLIRKLKPPILFLSVAVPYPGTELNRLMIEMKLLEQGGWDDYRMIGAPLHWRTKHFSAEQLRSLQKEILRRYYFRPSYLIPAVFRALGRGDFLYWIRSGLDFLRFRG